MPEYIERDALMQYPIRTNHCDKEHANWNFILGIESVLEYAENLPVIKARPIVHAHWKGSNYGSIMERVCSNCSAIVRQPSADPEDFYPYCPYCTADMRQNKDENNI